MKKASLSDLASMRERAKQKRQDYVRYDFSQKKNDALKTFFDLAQEYDEVDDLYRICVVVLEEMFQVECRLYILNNLTQQLELICDSQTGILNPPKKSDSHVCLSDKPYSAKSSFFAPIASKGLAVEGGVSPSPGPVLIGVLEVYPLAKLTEADKFFLTKYTNRIGYNLRKKMLAQQNISHLKFIKNLVADIEHNVIIPNMYFKHLFRQLRKRISELNQLKEFVQKANDEIGASPKCQETLCKISDLKTELGKAYTEIDKHHVNTTMFLESLFRRDHFEKGRFVLHNKILNVEKEIIKPQLDHYKNRLLERGIRIELPTDIRNENFTIQADLGLLAQVYANFFSNAVKYTKEIIDKEGRPRKIMAYGRRVLHDYYGPDKPGIKLNVFTTGPHLSSEEAKNIFIDGFKGYDSNEINSHGHGLAFVKMVIELHGGKVGHDMTEQGNNFYFILPIVNFEAQTSW